MTRRLVLGCGGLGERLVEALDPAGLTVIDRDPKVVEDLRESGIPARRASPTARSTFRELDPPQTVVVADDRTDRNVRSTELARERFPDAWILAYAGGNPTPARLERLEAVADDVLEPAETVASDLLDIVLASGAEKARNVRRALASIDGRLAVVTHDNPDPDAIASAVGLCDLAATVGVDADPCYFGEISHQENRAMVNLLELGLINLTRPEEIDDYAGIALVDHSRPGVNDGLTEDVAVDIVIDHHPPRGPVDGTVVDLRIDAGATSTILTEYHEHLGVAFETTTATALLYGIRIDTNEFTRETAAADVRAAATLFPHADHAALRRIESPTVGTETLDTIAFAIKNRVRYDDIVTASGGRIGSRDVLPQIADRLLSIEGVRTTLAYGLLEDMIYLSARSRDRTIDLGESVREAFEPIGNAGGHSDMAGAQIQIGVLGHVEEVDEDDTDDAILQAVEEVIANRFLEAIERRPDALVAVSTWEDVVSFDDHRS